MGVPNTEEPAAGGPEPLLLPPIHPRTMTKKMIDKKEGDSARVKPTGRLLQQLVEVSEHFYDANVLASPNTGEPRRCPPRFWSSPPINGHHIGGTSNPPCSHQLPRSAPTPESNGSRGWNHHHGQITRRTSAAEPHSALSMLWGPHVRRVEPNTTRRDAHTYGYPYVEDLSSRHSPLQTPPRSLLSFQ
ncbi:hypothetical protein BT67DRAFT_258085 [Trichocladium antarcticum]|uniref:Uncharacterized protein n=1 Tax=Trichocladium antarcticum TaxID=1450529 RepID=A0AAN6ZE31_9PEZI|nr:hypothetical protein BT67DRAFT_258085 [Trichocladium antarcticum]